MIQWVLHNRRVEKLAYLRRRGNHTSLVENRRVAGKVKTRVLTNLHGCTTLSGALQEVERQIDYLEKALREWPQIGLLEQTLNDRIDTLDRYLGRSLKGHRPLGSYDVTRKLQGDSERWERRLAYLRDQREHLLKVAATLSSPAL